MAENTPDPSAQPSVLPSPSSPLQEQVEAVLKKLSPREFLKARRPEKFSDSTVQGEQVLNRSMLEYFLDKLTNRSQEVDFENFARKLAQKEVCPNLLPHTGPTGGGDSKVDSETYPVADALSMAWFSGIGREASNERWAFAFSAVKQWQSKVRLDIEKIAKTGRKYSKAFFITNQYVRDKVRGNMEDELRKKFKLDVRILDRTWILDRVFENKHETLAIEELKLSLPVNQTTKIGPLDLQKREALEKTEARIKEATENDRFSYVFVEDCLKAAKLARGLELPRAQVDGLFLRAKQAAGQYGSETQKLLAAYQWAWTLYWWFEDYNRFSDSYGEVESLSKGSEKIDDLELLSNLWFPLLTAVRSNGLDPKAAKFDERTGVLLKELQRLEKQQDRPSGSLQAEASRLIVQLSLCPPAKADPLLDDLRKVIRRCAGLIGFPLETVVDILTVAGELLGDRPAYNRLHESIIRTVAERQGELSAARMLLQRGAQQLDNDKPYDAIRSLGRALGPLYKQESRKEMIRALYLCGSAYDRIGLIWAARGVVLIAASLASQGIRSPSDVSPTHVACFDKLKWLELRLGRFPHILAWHEIDIAAKGVLSERGYDLKRYDEYEKDFDLILGILLLKATLWDLKWLSSFPKILESLNLLASAESLRFALGHTDEIPDKAFSKENRESEIYKIFKALRNQPASRDLPAGPLLYEEQKVVLHSSVLGCQITAESQNSSPCIELTESILAALESLLATGIQDHLIAREPVFTIQVRASDFASMPFDFILKDVEGRPHLEIGCAVFNPHKMSLETQNQIKKRLGDLIIQVLGRICLIGDDIEKTVVKLFGDERALERAVNYTNSFIVIGNVLGDSPKTTLDSWSRLKAQDYPLKRTEEWDFQERQTKASSQEMKKRAPLAANEGEIPSSLVGMSDVRHTDIHVISLIRESLWDAADWRGTGFFHSSDGEPPVLALMFKNGVAGREIFTSWHKELGKIDNEEKLRLTIVRQIEKRNPYAYRVMITANPNFGTTPPKGKFKYIGMMSRLSTMEPASDLNISRFIAAYKAFGVYYLAAATLKSDDSEPELDMQSLILKKELNIREAWEIGRQDMDMVAIRSEDDPIIPHGKENAPVLELLEWKKKLEKNS